MPPFSPPIPVPADPGCSSALGATSPSYVEDNQQVFCPGFSDNTVGEWRHFAADVILFYLLPFQLFLFLHEMCYLRW